MECLDPAVLEAPHTTSPSFLKAELDFLPLRIGLSNPLCTYEFSSFPWPVSVQGHSMWSDF